MKETVGVGARIGQQQKVAVLGSNPKSFSVYSATSHCDRFEGNHQGARGTDAKTQSTSSCLEVSALLEV
jgi:uncharacterized ParB-like nuclease family protein